MYGCVQLWNLCLGILISVTEKKMYQNIQESRALIDNKMMILKIIHDAYNLYSNISTIFTYRLDQSYMSVNKSDLP